MLKSLINEAKIIVSIQVDSPLMIKSGTENVLNPSLPASQVIRQYRNGQAVEVIPGSSLKGVFRSRAEQILRSQGYHIEETFKSSTKDGENNTDPRKTEDGTKAYNESCLVGKLFGNLYLKSRIQFSDAYPITDIKTGTRTSVGIDRITGGSRGGALFTPEVVEAGTFQTTITLQNFELWQLSLVLWLIRDLDEGFLRLGSATSRGFGKVLAKVEQVQIRSFEMQKPGSAGEKLLAPIKGMDKEDSTMVEVEWSQDLFGATFSQGGLETWIGTDGYLSSVKFPAVSVN